MTKFSREGYLVIAGKLVPFLEKDHTSKISRAILAVFSNRTEYVCSLYFLPGCKPTWKGWFAKQLVIVVCAPTSFYFLGKHLVGKLIPTPFPHEV